MGFQLGNLAEELRLNWNQLSEPRKEEIKEELESILQELEALGAGLNQENKIMNEVMTVNQESSLPTVSEDYKAIALQWLTSTGNLKKFTENEKEQFFDICVAYKLNPIKKEVYGVKYGDNNFNIIVGYEVYLKRATRTGLLDGFSTTTEKTPDGDIKAICTIYRKDWTHPFTHEVYLSEYDTKKSLWATKKITMIKKVAEAQAFRKCFPDELGGIPYTAEELPEEMSKAPAPTEAVATEALKEAKKVNPDLEELTKILTESKYSNGQLIFTEEDKARAKASIKNYGVKKTLADCKEILSIKLESENKENQ